MFWLKKRTIGFKALTLFCFFCLFLFSLFLSEKFSQSFHFVDEDDHLVFAHFMNQKYKLYKDLSSNHQPLVYILSSLTQKITKPNTLFLLIRRGREAVFLYAFVLSLFLFSQFGLIFLIFALFFELTKFFLFGNLLLAESLAIYPLLYIIGMSFQITFTDYKPKKWQSFVFGLANFLIVFNLLPLIPSLLFFNLLYLIKTKHYKPLFAGFLLPTFILFLFISPLDWFRETVFYNFKYVVSELSPVKNKLDYLRFFIFPFLFFFQQQSAFNQFIRLFSVLLILNFALLFVFNKRKKTLGGLLFLLLILTLNNRVLKPEDAYYYRGFHLLPWYGGFIFFSLLTVKLIVQEIKKAVRSLPLLVLIGGGICAFLNPQMPYFIQIDKDREHNVNFLPYFLTGKAIKSISQPTDRLAVIPNESLLHWQAGLKPATRQIVYYEWEYWVPLLRQQMDEVFTNNPPEFIYADFQRIGQASYLPLLNSTLEKNYWQATKKGIPQNLFIKKEKIKKISDEQWKKWEKLSFDKITSSPY